MAICNGPKWTISASGGLGAVTNGIRARHWEVCQRGRWPPRGVIMRFHIGWRGEQSIPYMGVETFSLQTCFKTVRLTAICNGP